MLEHIPKEASFHSRLEGQESSTRAIKEMPPVVLIVSIRSVSLWSLLVIDKGLGWQREVDAQGHGNQERLVVGHMPNIEVPSE